MYKTSTTNQLKKERQPKFFNEKESLIGNSQRGNLNGQ